MRFREFRQPLTEARGMYHREPGDVFYDNAGELEFQSVTPYPSVGKFSDIEERDAAVNDVENITNNQISWLNNPTNRSMAFSIVELADQKGNSVFWGKFHDAIKPDGTGAWANDGPDGFKFKTGGGEGSTTSKEDAGVKPQDLIKTEKPFKTVKSILTAVKKNARDEHKDILVNALRELAVGSMDVTFKGLADDLPAIRDYFGEVMQPVALMGGNITGQADAARVELAGGASWSECSVKWPMSESEPLIDSILIAPNGQEIGISTKGGAGAAAGIKNIYDAAEKARAAGNKKLLKTAAFTIKVSEIVQTSSALTAPIMLAKLLGVRVATNKLQKEIEDYVRSGKTDIKGVSPTGLKLISYSGAKPGFKTGYAILTGLARLVAAKINSNRDFSAGALALLNQSSILQIYTTMSKRGKDAKLNGFRAVYPPAFDGHLIFDVKKHYMATANKGKPTFKFGNTVDYSRAGTMPIASAIPPKQTAKKKPASALSAASGGVKKK